MALVGSVADSFMRGLCEVDVVNLENLPAPVQLKQLITREGALRETASPPKQTGVSAEHRTANG